MSINFARLNHILIPSTKAGRDRFRKSPFGRMVRPALFVVTSLSAEGQLFAAATLFAAAFGFEVRATEAHVLWSALASLLVVSLLATRFYRLDKVRIDVTPPRRVTVGEEITFTLSVHNDGANDQHALRFAGPFLPWDGKWTRGAPKLRAVKAHATQSVEMFARFIERGQHHLDPFGAAALVPFGLALGPAKRTSGCRFLVVPKIANVARVRTPMGRRHQPGGVALASYKGESKDLLGVRPYRPGDPVRDLHARSWARIGAPVVREYQQEYFSRIGVILDTDVSVADEALLDAAISLAAGVVRQLCHGEALIDVLVVGPRVHRLTLGRSLGTFEQALDLLACVEPGAPFDAETLLAECDPHLARLSCVIMVALAWDDGRAAVVDRIRAMGVGCKALVVGEGGSAPVRGGEVLYVSRAAIVRGEALTL